VIAVVAYVRGSQVFAATTPMNCNLSAYQGTSGLPPRPTAIRSCSRGTATAIRRCGGLIH